MPTTMLPSLIFATLAASCVTAGHVYPRDYFLEVPKSDFHAIQRAINATTCETVLSSNLTGQFLVSCPCKKARKALVKVCGKRRLLDVSEDTLAKPVRINSKCSRSCNKNGAALHKKYSSTPRYPFQWTLRAAGADAAWKKGCDGTGVTIAAIGSRPYCSHPALAPNLLKDKAFSFTNISACVAPGETLEDDSLPNFITSLISAAVANNVNMTGVAPGAKFFPVNAANDVDEQLASAMLYAAAAGADVIITLPVLPDTLKNQTKEIKMFRTTFRAVERLGALPVLYGNYGPAVFENGDDIIQKFKNGSLVTFAEMGRSVVHVRGTHHSNEWCPKGLTDYSALRGPASPTTAKLAATCGNATYVNQYTKKRPFTAVDPIEVDTPLTDGVATNVGKPHVCVAAGTYQGRCYNGCEKTCNVNATFQGFCSSCKADSQCTIAVYNAATAGSPCAKSESSYSYDWVVHAEPITAGAAALLLQAYPEYKGRPYALRQLLLSSAKTTARATRSECGSGFLNLKHIFGK